MAEGDAEMASSVSAAAAAADSPAAAVPAGDEGGASDSDGEQQRRKKKRKAVDDASDGDADADDAAGGDDDDAAAASDAGESSDGGEKKKRKKHKKHKKHKKEKKKHKKSVPGSRFIDDIAVNDDDEDERDDESDDSEEEDNGDGEADDGEDLEATAEDDARDAEEDAETPEERKARKKAQKAQRRLGGGGDVSDDETMHMTLDQERDLEEQRRLQEQVADRYRNASGYNEADYDEDGANGRSRGSVLPSIKDPRLFLVQLRRGVDEREALRALLKEFQLREDGADESRKFHILSAFTTPASRGRIYVEAFKEAHLKSALASVPLGKSLYNAFSPLLVDIQQMVGALKFRSLEKGVAEGAWVRVKSGPFKEDLAKVVRLQDHGSSITLKLVPRIDFSFLHAKSENDKLTKMEFKRIRGSNYRRPQQKLFSRGEISALGFSNRIEKKRGTGAMDKDTMYHLFMSETFKGGFQYKDFKIDALLLENVLPTAAELDMFAQRGHDSDDDDDDDTEQKEQMDSAAAAHLAAQNAPRRAAVYSLNDRVLIASGPLKNITGRVRGIQKDRLSIVPDIPNAVSVDEVYANVRKYFEIGTHVKVVAGIRKGETGMIDFVFNEADSAEGEQQVSMVTDGSKQTFIVAAQDIVESSEISTGRDEFGGYALGELVQLRGDLVGTIVRFTLTSIIVLTSTGVVQDVRLQEVVGKRGDRFARTTDRNMHEVELGDVVYPLSGPQRGKKATVKHIFKKTLFLHSPDLLDNGGLFTIRGEQVSLPQTNAPSKGLNAPKSPGAGARSPGPAPRSPSHNAAGGGAGPPRAGRPFRDPIIGKEVIITGGQYKSYKGVCLDVMDTHARVEIRAMFRKVQVPRAQITILENVARAPSYAGGGGHRDVMYGGATPLVGGATPAHSGFGSQTPHHGSDMGGSMTPYGGGSRTPSHRTPSHDGGDAGVWAPQTPARRHDGGDDEEGGAGAAGGADDEEEEEWRQTVMQQDGADVRTPGGAAANPVTPGAGGGVPQTPRTPFAPQTPYDPTTPHGAAAGMDMDEDMAPAVPQTPATPYNPQAAAQQAEDDAAAAAAAEEEELAATQAAAARAQADAEAAAAAAAEAAAAAAAAVPAGPQVSPDCHVRLTSEAASRLGVDVAAVFTVASVEDDGLRVRSLASGGEPVHVGADEVVPVHPDANTSKATWVVLLQPAELGGTLHEAGTVCKLESIMGAQWMALLNGKDPIFIDQAQFALFAITEDSKPAKKGARKGKK